MYMYICSYNANQLVHCIPTCMFKVAGFKKPVTNYSTTLSSTVSQTVICMCIYVYTHTYTHTHIYIYIYVT